MIRKPFRKMPGGGGGSEGPTPPGGEPPDDGIGEDDPRIEAGYWRRQVYWDAIGPSDGDFLTYLINPQFQGAPAWPNTRQAYRVVRPAGRLIIASDGLSDPFVGTNLTDRQGFGCQVYIEAPQLAARISKPSAQAGRSRSSRASLRTSPMLPACRQ